MEITVLSGQSLIDIALMVTGSAEGAFLLALENDLSVTDELVPGTKLNFTGEVINQRVVDYYRTNNIQPATAVIGWVEERTRIFSKEFAIQFA